MNTKRMNRKWLVTLLVVGAHLGVQLVSPNTTAAADSAANADATQKQPAYVRTLLDDARLIAHYRLNEDPAKTTQIIDASSHKRDAELHGQTLATDGPGSLPNDNRAIDLDGKGMISLENKPVDMKQLTFVCFFKSTDTTSKEQRIFTTSKFSRYQFALLIDQGNLRAIIEAPGVGGAGTMTTLSTDKELDGKWHHLIVSRSGNAWSDVQIWIDFKPATIQEGNWTSKGLLDNEAVIGSRSLSPHSALHGALDEVSFLEGAFTQADVDKLKAALSELQ